MRKIISIVFVLLMATIATAHGQPEANCHSIKDSVDQLRCHDAAVIKAQAVTIKAQKALIKALEAVIKEQSLCGLHSARFDGIIYSTGADDSAKH